MKQKIFSLLACAVVAALSALSSSHGRQTLMQVEQRLRSRVGVSLCSLAESGSEGEKRRTYVILLNLNGERIGWQVGFDEHGHVDPVAGTCWSVLPLTLIT